MKFPASLAILTAGLLLFAEPSSAFWSRKPKEKSPNEEIRTKPLKPNKSIRVTETADSIILFYFTGAKEKRLNGLGENKNFLEISYKISIRAEDPYRLFSSSPEWAKVRFLDSEGFSLAEDKIRFQDLLRGREYYGFAWIEERKAGVLRKADTQPLKSDEIPVPAPVAAPPQPAAPVSVPEPAPAPEPEPKPAEAVPQPVVQSPAPETAAPSSNGEIKPAEPVVEKAPEIPAAPALLEAPSEKAAQAPAEFSRGGVTNEDVQGVLQEQDNKPGTVIEESKPLPPELLNAEQV